MPASSPNQFAVGGKANMARSTWAAMKQGTLLPLAAAKQIVLDTASRILGPSMGRGWTLHSRGPDPQNPFHLRARILWVLTAHNGKKPRRRIRNLQSYRFGHCSSQRLNADVVLFVFVLFPNGLLFGGFSLMKKDTDHSVRTPCNRMPQEPSIYRIVR